MTVPRESAGEESMPMASDSLFGLVSSLSEEQEYPGEDCHSRVVTSKQSAAEKNGFLQGKIAAS